MSKELLEAVKLFISQPLNNPLSRGQIMEIARIALPMLQQQERGEGEWIEWGGGKQPIAIGKKVDVRYRDGVELYGMQMGALFQPNGSHMDIIAYRIIPELATNQNGESS